MNTSLSQIQAKLAEASALRSDALDTVRQLALGRLDAAPDMRLALVSKFDGYEREFQALVKVERDVIATGRSPSPDSAASADLADATETRFAASGAHSAAMTHPTAHSEPEPPREAPRSPAHFAAGDGF